MSITINFCSVWMYNKEFPSIKSPDPLILWFCKVPYNTLDAVSLLPHGLWTLNFAK